MWPLEDTLVIRTQPSGPLCLWQCLRLKQCKAVWIVWAVSTVHTAVRPPSLKVFYQLRSIFQLLIYCVFLTSCQWSCKVIPLLITNIAEGSTPINKLKCCCESQIFLICCRSWWIVQKATFRNDYIFFNLSFESCPGLFLRNTPQIYDENIFPGSSSIFVSFVGWDRKVQAGKILENIKGKTWTNLQLVVNPHPLLRI